MSSGPPIDEPVRVVDHDPRWALQAAHIIDEVGRIAQARSVHHIGSTAVAGLSAKPIIDLMVDIPSADREAAARELAAEGFNDFGEISAGRRYLTRRSPPATNIHFIDSSSSLWSRLLAYSDAKAPIVEEILHAARAWRAHRTGSGRISD